MPALTLDNTMAREGSFNSIPSLTLTTNKPYDGVCFIPDSKSYFVLSEAGRNYHYEGNDSILLNINKGYYLSEFELTTNRTTVISISNQLFQGTNPLTGKALEVLKYTLKMGGKRDTSLSNRL